MEAELARVLQHVLECLDIPDSNCSCHICPPCNDCVEYGAIREAVKYANISLTKFNKMLDNRKMNFQENLMKFCPAYGTPTPYPSHSAQYRKYHGDVAWLFNPWTGEKRDPRDIGSDVFGNLIITDGEANES